MSVSLSPVIDSAKALASFTNSTDEIVGLSRSMNLYTVYLQYHQLTPEKLEQVIKHLSLQLTPPTDAWQSVDIDESIQELMPRLVLLLNLVLTRINNESFHSLFNELVATFADMEILLKHVGITNKHSLIIDTHPTSLLLAELRLREIKEELTYREQFES